MSVVQQALATNRAFLFPVERFDEAAVCLETMFPDTFRDLSYVRVNQAERTQDLDQETTELLREQLADDLPVYELACQELERCIEQCFRYREDFEIALRDFQARGAVRRDNFNPLFLDRGLKTQKPPHSSGVNRTGKSYCPPFFCHLHRCRITRQIGRKRTAILRENSGRHKFGGSKGPLAPSWISPNLDLATRLTKSVCFVRERIPRINGIRFTLGR
jgi:hypothetical protein